METKHLTRNFLCEEDGQTTVEYILILAVILTIFMQFRKRILIIVTKIFKALDDGTDKATQFEDP